MVNRKLVKTVARGRNVYDPSEPPHTLLWWEKGESQATAFAQRHPKITSLELLRAEAKKISENSWQFPDESVVVVTPRSKTDSNTQGEYSSGIS